MRQNAIVIRNADWEYRKTCEKNNNLAEVFIPISQRWLSKLDG